MTITNLIPALRGNGAHRAVDEVERLREENTTLLNQQAAASEFFETQAKLITDLERDVRTLKADAEQAKRTIGQLEEVIRLRDRQIDDLNRRVEVGVNAEHIIAKTQAMDTAEIREACAKPVPLHQSPLATATSPVNVPTWGDTDTRPLRTIAEAS